MAARHKKPAKKLSEKQPEPDMNVTPLVDVVLVLLIIFMVVTPAIAQGDTLSLPDVAKIDKKPKDMNPLKLTLRADGKMSLNDARVDSAQLAERLKKIHAHDPNRNLLMSTDTRVPYVKVRETLALLTSTGFKGVSLKVNHKKPKE
jgi:biopolymer transport protein ExbD/biopolymer transport protein TolR